MRKFLGQFRNKRTLFMRFFTQREIEVVFRPPSCMAVSRSYPRHLVKFREKEKEMI